MSKILSVLSQFGIKYRRIGDKYTCLCPLHNDTDESLVIYPATDSWCCFGNCISNGGKRNGGDLISFIMQYKNWSFYEADVWLKDQFSFNVKTEPLPDLTPPKPKVVPHDFIIYWHSQLTDRSWFYKRGFNDEIINREMWGWDGERYCLPVWEGEPQYSKCLGVRKRRPDNGEGPKYIGLTGMNQPTVWGRWYCQDKETIFAFAGELDAAKAVLDGFPAFSLVNGVSSYHRFPKNWPDLWFPKAKKMIVVFDKKEEIIAGQFASYWNRFKGLMSAKVFHWNNGIKDYCEFRENLGIDSFNNLLICQKLYSETQCRSSITKNVYYPSF